MELENIKAKLPVAPLIRSMLDGGFSTDQAAVGMDEYCRFLALLAVMGEPLRPTKLGDEVLHRHLEMDCFGDDCLNIVGAKIRHEPNAEESTEMTALWQRTRELTLAKFGIDPAIVGNDNSHHTTIERAAPCHVTLEHAA
jgi:hypothetical protein